ncbi:MAG: hypothetical protein HY319_15430 [Armatimonadetes bacterium]|nr:hypothetical protein [Armatimonadota bacterium]
MEPGEILPAGIPPQVKHDRVEYVWFGPVRVAIPVHDETAGRFLAPAHLLR